MITADRNKIFRRIHDQHIMGETINLGIDYSTGTPRVDNISYYEQIQHPDKQMVIETYLSEQELESIKPLFDQWKTGEVIWAKDVNKPADIRIYNDKLYKCLQSHTTQASWTPDIVPALWTAFIPTGTIAEWVQPLGSEDAYQIGDKVTHSGFIWESTAANNVWEPGVYGWIDLGVV